jgi:hypothetical protein
MQVLRGRIQQLANTKVEFDINTPVQSSNANLAAEVQEVTQTSTPQIVWKLDFTPASENPYRAYRVPRLYPGFLGSTRKMTVSFCHCRLRLHLSVRAEKLT